VEAKAGAIIGEVNGLIVPRRLARSAITCNSITHARQSPDQISLTAFQKVGLKAPGTRDRAKRVRGGLNAPSSGPINARGSYLSAPQGPKVGSASAEGEHALRKAWVPYEAGPLLTPLHANASALTRTNPPAPDLANPLSAQA
jgi:hypothetical protein